MGASYQLMYFFTGDALPAEALRLTDAACRILGPHGITLRIWPPGGTRMAENALPFDRPLDRWTECWLPYMHVVRQERFVGVLNHWMPVFFCRYREGQNSAATTLREPVNQVGPCVLVNTRLTGGKGEIALAHELGHAAGDLKDITDTSYDQNLMFFDIGQSKGTNLADWQVRRMLTGAYFRA